MAANKPRINLRFSVQEFEKLDDRRHKTGTKFQAIGAALLKAWEHYAPGDDFRQMVIDAWRQEDPKAKLELWDSGARASDTKSLERTRQIGGVWDDILKAAVASNDPEVRRMLTDALRSIAPALGIRLSKDTAPNRSKHSA